VTYDIEMKEVPWDELNGKLESEAHKQRCMVGATIPAVETGAGGGPGVILQTCIGSHCGHWRWLHRGGTRYERHSFQSEYPVPDGNKPPADVPDGWTFDGWDVNVLVNGAKAYARTPRFWCRRAVEIVLPRGMCGLVRE
jgi:hypothetical protein